MDLLKRTGVRFTENRVYGAAAVPGEARDDVDVQMGDGLARSPPIVDPNSERWGTQRTSDALRDLLDCLEELPCKLWGQIREPFGMGFRDDEGMPIGHRVNVEKCYSL